MHGIPDWKYKVIRPTGVSDGNLISISTREVLVEAEKYGITWEEIVGTRIFRLNYHGVTREFYAQVPTSVTELGFNSCLDKSITRALLQAVGVNIPKGYGLTKGDTQDYWMEVFNALQKPLVVKPTHGNQGRSVFMNIKTPEEYQQAVKESFSFSNESNQGVVVEETFAGTEYRVLATKQKVIGIINRIPANVIGDGQKTIQQLVDEKNSDPRRSPIKEDPLCTIEIDQHVQKHLADQQITLDTVPAAGQRVFLRQNSNISTGGDSIDVTDVAHPSVKEIALKVMAAIPGLKVS
jgi:cyanophycin synthetase